MMCCAKGFIVFLIAALTVALPLETCAQSPGTKAAFTQRAQELFLREAGSNGRFANRCQDAQVAKAAAAIASEQLQQSSSVQSAYQSISILAKLHKSKQLAQPVPAGHIENVLNFFKGLGDSSGTFKMSKSSPKPSILATGLIYQALAEARSLDISLSSEAETAVEEIRASLAQVLQGGKAGQATLFLPGDDDQLEAAAQLVIGAAAVYDESFASITGAQLSGAAQLFSGAQHVHSLADAAQVGPALTALTQSALPSPLHATLATPGIGLDYKESIVITVSNAWGQAVPAGSVSLEVMPRDAATKGKPTKQNLQPGSGTGEYLYDVAAASLKPGSYLLRVIIEDTAGRAAGQSELTLTVSGELQNASLVLAFSEGETEDASNETLHYPMTLSTMSATLDPSQTLKASLVVEGLTPHQKMLRLASKQTGAAAYFNLKPSRVKDQTYTITITSNSIDKQVGSQAGEYDMELLIGDKAIGSPVRWHLTTVTVSYQANEDGPQSALPSAASATAALQAHFKPKPEIVHIQRAPGKSPPKAISLLFTGLSLLPLLLLFHMLQLAGANLKGFPSSGSGFIAAMAFHGGIASILGLYTLFWLKLNLMQTLPILLVLGLFTTVAGYNALSRQAEARLKQV